MKVKDLIPLISNYVRVRDFTTKNTIDEGYIDQIQKRFQDREVKRIGANYAVTVFVVEVFI